MGIVMLGALGAWACSDDSGETGGTGGTGGSHAGTGGTGGSGGSHAGTGGSGGSHAGTGGSGGSHAGTGGSEAGAGGAIDCPATTLADFCDLPQAHCPKTPSEVALACEPFQTSERRSSSCGGVAIVEDFGLGGNEWHFDADGNLVAYVALSDVQDECSPDGVTVYGKDCKVSGGAIDLCDRPCSGAAGAGGDCGAGGQGGQGGAP